MNIRGKSVMFAAGVLAAILATPALAQGHGGGGGHAGGGGHIGGGGHAGVASHASGGHFGGGGVRAYGAGGAHYAAAYHGSAGLHAGYQARGGYGYPGHYGGGYSYGHGYSTGAYWGGGYWRGGYWPRAYYGLGFSWFLPVLPLAYATYWWGGVPYYYANDVYYTYDPNYQGYVASDPPPVADSSGSSAAPSDAGAAPAGAAPADAAQSGPIDGAPAQIFMYPKNGQNAEQQARDKAECQQWATEQAGSVAQNGSNFNRAMVACVEGRGYSAR